MTRLILSEMHLIQIKASCKRAHTVPVGREPQSETRKAARNARGLTQQAQLFPAQTQESFKIAAPMLTWARVPMSAAMVLCSA